MCPELPKEYFLISSYVSLFFFFSLSLFPFSHWLSLFWPVLNNCRQPSCWEPRAHVGRLSSPQCSHPICCFAPFDICHQQHQTTVRKPAKPSMLPSTLLCSSTPYSWCLKPASLEHSSEKSTGTGQDLIFVNWNKVVEPLSYIDNNSDQLESIVKWTCHWQAGSTYLSNSFLKARISTTFELHFAGWSYFCSKSSFLPPNSLPFVIFFSIICTTWFVHLRSHEHCSLSSNGFEANSKDTFALLLGSVPEKYLCLNVFGGIWYSLSFDVLGSL